jgi:predicted outer membrane repeat protein
MAITRGGLTITNSTISGNSAGTDYGGGIYAEAIVRGGVRVRLTNSTVSGNSAAVGGGMYTQGEFYSSALVYLVNTTVAFNTATETGGGIVQVGYADEFTLLDLVNALVAKNAAPAAPDVSNDAYAYVSSVHSLIGDGTGSGIGNDGGNLVGNVAPYTAPIDPELDLLDRNGGLTATHALLSGSPAIDAGTAEGCPATDQRGVSRPQGEACDIGSFERQ